MYQSEAAGAGYLYDTGYNNRRTHGDPRYETSRNGESSNVSSYIEQEQKFLNKYKRNNDKALTSYSSKLGRALSSGGEPVPPLLTEEPYSLYEPENKKIKSPVYSKLSQISKTDTKSLTKKSTISLKFETPVMKQRIHYHSPKGAVSMLFGGARESEISRQILQRALIKNPYTQSQISTFHSRISPLRAKFEHLSIKNHDGGQIFESNHSRITSQLSRDTRMPNRGKWSKPINIDNSLQKTDVSPQNNDNSPASRDSHIHTRHDDTNIDYQTAEIDTVQAYTSDNIKNSGNKINNRLNRDSVDDHDRDELSSVDDNRDRFNDDHSVEDRSERDDLEDPVLIAIEPPQVIIIGETGGSLSECFRKRNPAKKTESENPRVSEKAKTKEQREDPRTKEGKEALRKKMMMYGKKEGSKKEKAKPIENEYSELISQVNAAKKKMSEAKAVELERMARGIKPKINHSEIKEITKRSMKRFAQSTIHESRIDHHKSIIEDSMSMHAKRDEVKLRKMKALDMDKVVYRLFRKFEINS